MGGPKKCLLHFGMVHPRKVALKGWWLYIYLIWFKLHGHPTSTTSKIGPSIHGGNWKQLHRHFGVQPSVASKIEARATPSSVTSHISFEQQLLISIPIILIRPGAVCCRESSNGVYALSFNMLKHLRRIAQGQCLESSQTTNPKTQTPKP